VAAGELAHVAVDQVEARGDDDIDAHEEQDGLEVDVDDLEPGQPHEDGEENKQQ